MRIIVNGQQAFGRAVLEALLERDETVVGVFTAPDSDSGPQDPLKLCALEHNLPVMQPKSFRTPETMDQIQQLKPDLCVMAYVTKIVPEPVLNAPTFGTIQYHPSLLPMHKGPSAINWPIIFGETSTGLSIFWPDDGLDTGPILLQKHVDITLDDTLGSVYFDKLFPLGVEAMLEAVDRVREGTAPRNDQDPEAGSYEGWCRSEQAEIDWSEPVENVYNLIRGCNPQPGAWTFFKGKQVQIFDVRRVQECDARPGEVIRLTDENMEVAASGGSIEVMRVRPSGQGKMPVREYCESVVLQPGDIFGV